MIEIRKVENQDRAIDLCREAGIEWHPAYHVIATFEGHKAVHYAIFSYEKEQGRIEAIGGFGGDLALLDGLCRAILNIMDLNGVKEVYLPLKYKELGRHVGFQQKEDGFVLSLSGFFKCCGKKGE